MSPIPDPGEMLAAADRISAHARAAREWADRLAAAVGAVHWQGAAANAFYGQAQHVISGLRRSAERLDDAADALRRHAHRIEAKLAHLTRLLPGVGHLGLDVVHGVGDMLTHPTGLLHDSVSVLNDTTGLVRDIAGVVKP